MPCKIEEAGKMEGFVLRFCHSVSVRIAQKYVNRSFLVLKHVLAFLQVAHTLIALKVI